LLYLCPPPPSSPPLLASEDVGVACNPNGNELSAAAATAAKAAAKRVAWAAVVPHI